MASMRDFLDNMAAPVRSRGAVRLALHNPNARSASDIAGVERTARTLGMGYGLADAGGQDAALEARAREIEQNPVADAWTAKDEENIAFLNEDQQALADVYDSLVASGILHEADADRETVINASGAGDDVAAAWKRGVILNRIAGYGLQFQRGEYENLDELRANILAAQKELEALRGNASDALGIYGAIEQLPRMIGYDAQYAGAGALVGGTIGSAVPGIGTLAGAGVGGAMGMAYTAANSEQGSFAADLLVQKDDAGNYLDPAAVQKAASLYGLLSGAVEVGGDALMFKLFKPVGGTIREAFSRRAARDAIREAAANRSLWPALRAFAGGAGKAAAVEGAQEFAQEGISTQIEATAKNLLSDAGANYYREQQAGAFSREGLSRMLEAGMAAAKTGPWFYAIPGGIRLTLDTRSALRAREFAEAHKELADKVAATRTRELSPARMESYLQTAGLDGDVLIPADAAWELQRKGTDLAGPLGWDVRDMEESAALGHDLVMPAARLQALLPPEQMKAVADIMRESPHAKSALEAANLNEDLPADMDGLIEQAEDDALERSAIEGELERLRGEMTQAVASAPHLVGQIASGADAETSVGRYVDEHLGLIVRRARDISRMGIPMSDTLSRVSLQGLLKDEQGRTVTPEEADALAGRNAEEEALAPFWDAVWGRLNPDSLRTDFPDARRELAYRHGRGLFAGKGEGLSVDALAEELKTRGLLDSDADSSTLIERLKGMQRPDRRTRGKVGALFQVEGETIAAMQHRIREWLSPENLAQAQGKTREEIFAMFGNELEPIAVLPPQYLHYFRQAGSDNRIYSGKGYFIDHAVNHHPEVSSERYQDIQLILNSPDEVLLDRRTANAKVRDGLIFVKELDANYAVAVSMEEGSDGKIVMHKTFFKTKKNPFKKLERVPTSVGGVSTISHAAETVPGSSLSARDVEINITSTTQHVKSSLNQGNTSALGSTTFDASGNYVIRLFRGANLSTLTHETAHVFFLEMERLEREGLADERMLADLAALREWTAAMDDDAALKAEYDRYQKYAAYGGAEFDALPDYLKEDARSRAKQEMLARGFEQYLREGKAPSPQLEGVFARFRKWLMRVYRDALDLHVELSDEVRDVFDRMLAHEEEMELRAEAADVREETARLLDALELKGAGRQEIEGLITAAKDEAAERLRRARDADRLEQRRAWTREAREQMEREQVYVTRRAICRTPIDLAGFNDVNGEELGRALVGKLPGAAAWREGGVEPEVFAAEQGYGSAAAMARDIIDSPTPEERVRQLVDKRQAEHDALFDADEYLFGREQLAEQRERIAEALEAKVQAVTAEQRHRREAAGRTVSGEEAIPAPDDCADCGSAARRLAGRDRLRARARAVLDKRPMGEEVMPEQFRRAASRWMREERRAILRGDFGKALQANCRTRINIELARQSAERRGMLRTLEKKAKEFLEMDRADSDARFAVLVLSQNIGLFNPTRGMLADAGGKGWENVEAFAARMREVGLMGAEDALDRELFTTSRAWKGMKWGEFRPYAETMRMIMHMERESRTAETASGRVALEARAREIADSIHENNTRREPEARAERNEAVELLKKFHAAHLKADTVALLDGDIMGAAWRAIVRPVSDAAGKRAERLRRERDVLRKLFSVYSRRELEDMKGKRFTVPGIPDAITKEQALSVLLNSGSAGNLRRLMAGRNLAEEQIRAIVDTLDERDVRFAQAVWDYFETFGKEISDLEESLTGVRPEAVEARPVQTRFGLLRGGYYPVACDRELSARPVDTDRLGTQTGGMFPSLSRGPLKQRQAVGLGTPLSLSLDVIPRHVAETVHMLTFRRPVTEAAKILRRREVNGAIRETAGVAAAEALDGWLRHVAGERPARGGWDRAASWARKNAALYTMGFRLSAMLARMTGLLSPVAEIGPRWALRGVVDSYGRGSPLDVCRTVMELSPMMRDRIMSADREVFEVSSRLMEPDSSSRASDPFARMKSFMETRGSVPMGWVRMYFADLPIWNGAYARALKENGGDIAEAVLYADAVVERARAGGAARDLAAVRPGWEPGRLMTMFYSCFSALYNLSARRVAMLDMRRDAAAVYRLATLALPTWFAEPALMGALPGGGPDARNVGNKTDAEDWIAWGAKEAFFHPAGMVFDMREAASPESCPDSCQDSWQDAFDSAMRFGARAGKALQDGADGRELLSGRETTEQDTGFITARELQLLETFRDWLDGTSPERELGSLIRKKNRQAENE